MMQDNISISEKLTIFEEWDERDERLNNIFKKNDEYNKIQTNAIDIWEKLKKVSLDNDFQKLILSFESQLAYQEGIVMDLSYKQGVKDGIRTIIESLQNP